MKAGADGSACELCGGEASAYCDSDSAFLCSHCDARVHSANFLVARHLRRPLCSLCHRSHPLLPPFSGPSSSHSLPPVCHSCSSPCSSSSSSSSCVSTADKDAIVISASMRMCRRTTLRPEEVVAEWCLRLGMEGGGGLGVATHAAGVGSRKLTSLPARVCAAAAVWFAVKVTGGGGRRGAAGLLRKLEACSGVPAKAILMAELRLAGVVRRVPVEAEGWDEC